MAAVAGVADGVLRRLEWQVLRRLDGALQGAHETLRPGIGLDFHDIREYAPGDDVRHVDWNVSARMGDLHVRQYNDEREVTAWLLLDRSPSMGFGPQDRPKSQVLCEVAGAVARLLVRGGDRVGALLYADGTEQAIPPRGGRPQVLRIMHELLRDPPATHGRTALDGLLSTAAGMLRRRSVVVLISDFQSEPGWEHALGVLAQRHEVVAVRVVDPRERDLPDAGVIVVEDAETGEQLTVDTSDPGVRRRLAVLQAEQDEAVRAAGARSGVALHDVSTEDDLVAVLVRLVQTRRRRRR